jgi:ribosomal protein S27E
MDHIERAGRTLRLRCPKCSLLNTYAPNDYIQCRNCGLAKTKGE